MEPQRPEAVRQGRLTLVSLQAAGPYLIHHVTFMRTFSQYLTGFKNYHPSQIAEAMALRTSCEAW